MVELISGLGSNGSVYKYDFTGVSLGRFYRLTVVTRVLGKFTWNFDHALGIGYEATCS